MIWLPKRMQVTQIRGLRGALGTEHNGGNMRYLRHLFVYLSIIAALLLTLSAPAGASEINVDHIVLTNMSDCVFIYKAHSNKKGEDITTPSGFTKGTMEYSGEVMEVIKGESCKEGEFSFRTIDFNITLEPGKRYLIFLAKSSLDPSLWRFVGGKDGIFEVSNEGGEEVVKNERNNINIFKGLRVGEGQTPFLKSLEKDKRFNGKREGPISKQVFVEMIKDAIGGNR